MRNTAGGLVSRSLRVERGHQLKIIRVLYFDTGKRGHPSPDSGTRRSHHRSFRTNKTIDGRA
jgi:hypothetical protein